MEQHPGTEPTHQSTGTQSAALEATSAPWVGQWNRLISTTNWEKGRIISQWRQDLMEAGAPQQACSDEAWSRRVGNVSGQHVGRLRRVYEQFGQVHQEYQGLYWSHFQAALDWHDAEMWLEGAVQSGWSVAQLRAQRWETMGAPADQKPKDEEIVSAEWDEDVAPPEDSSPDTIGESLGMVQDPDAELAEPAGAVASDDSAPAAEVTAAEPVRPFEDLPPLPDDLNEAFEAFKLAILHHKLSGWQEIPVQDVLATLDALKQLALAPTEG